MLEPTFQQLSIRRQSQLLAVNRASHYYVASTTSKQDTLLSNEIQDIWLRHPFYGYRRITIELQSMGYQVNKKRVQRLMQLMKIKALYPKPNTSKKIQSHAVYPYLLGETAVSKSNQAWQIDITYLRHRGSFMYLVALIDVHSRYVVSWELTNTLHTDSCLEALKQGVKTNKPELINSDQGCQFTSEAWVSALKDNDIKISMTGKGRCHDNIFIERFWRTIKYEEIYLNDYSSVTELRLAIERFIEFYNHKRWHQSLGYKTPADIYYGSQNKPVHMMDNANALPTSTQAQQQQVFNNKGSKVSLN
jgi:putative transposase